MATAAREIVPAKSRKVDGRRNNRGTIGNKGGHPEWKPEIKKVESRTHPGTYKTETEEQAMDRTKRTIQHYVACGFSQEIIARIMEPPMSVDTLKRRFNFELENGHFMALGRMAATIFQQGVSGADPGQARFWMRARGGWRDTGDVKTPTAPIQFKKIRGDDW